MMRKRALICVVAMMICSSILNGCSEGVKPADKQEETSRFSGTIEILDSAGTVLIGTEDLEKIDTCTLEDGYGVEILLTDDGAEKLKIATEENLGKKLDFCVNGVCVSSPMVNTIIINGKVQISGFDTLTSAYEIVSAVKNGGDVEKTENQKKQEELANELADALKSIGVKEVLSVTYDKYEATGNVMLEVDAHITTDAKELIARCTYLNDKWSVTYINDADTNNMYYPTTGKNAYDYTSGECINPVEETEAPKEEPQEVPQGAKTRDVTKLEIMGQSIIDIVKNDMTDWYDYIKDIYIQTSNSGEEIQIVVQVTSATDNDLAKEAGEDVARYLASQACNANSYYKSPGSDYLGGLYDRYDLLIYVDDGNKTHDIYGAKVTTSNTITWK